MAANTLNVFHLCLQSFAITSSPDALQWLLLPIWRILFYSQSAIGWSGNISGLVLRSKIISTKLEIPQSVEKNSLPSINPVIIFKSLLWSSKTSFAFVLSFQVRTESYIVPTEDFFCPLPSSCLVSPFPCWVQSWEMQSTLALTETHRRQDDCGLRPWGWVRALDIFLCK